MALEKFKAPTLPVPPREYDQNYMSQLVRALGNYFVLLDSQAPMSANNITLTSVPQSNDYPPADLRAGTGFQLSGEDVFRVKVDGVTPEPIPTEAGIDVKVAAGVATAEAYADANFVNLTGDTMTGDLTLPTLNSTTTNATTVNTSNLTGTVSVPSGSSVSGLNAGSVRAPGTILQVQQKTWTNTTALSNGVWTPITFSYLTVTPLYATSKMLCVVQYQGYGTQAAGGIGFSTRICMNAVPDYTPPQFYESYTSAAVLYAVTTKSGYFTITDTTAKVFSVEAGLYNATSGSNNEGGFFQSVITVYEIAQ